MFSTIFQPVLTELSKAPPETAAIVGMTTVSLFALWGNWCRTNGIRGFTPKRGP